MKPGSQGNVILHGFVHGISANHQQSGPVEVVLGHIQAVLMLLGNGFSQEKRVHHHGTNGLVSGIIDGTAIFGSQLHVVLGAVAPVGGNVGKGSFHVISSFLPTSGHKKAAAKGCDNHGCIAWCSSDLLWTRS